MFVQNGENISLFFVHGFDGNEAFTAESNRCSE